MKGFQSIFDGHNYTKVLITELEIHFCTAYENKLKL